MVFDRVDAERESEFALLAADVVADLEFLGVLVFDAGDSTKGTQVPPGHAYVFYDPIIDGMPGVYVAWEPSDQAVDAITGLAAAPPRRKRLVHAGWRAMIDALADTLAAGGWSLDRSDTGTYELTIRVVGPPEPG
ncbi:hypothetical protein [Nocardia sputi]|uniref:hypothetical protein n=1 Tax=Nocardia sputi TaxID=2943705 RepID=UPI001892E7FC|nr:hypothetical protein [Nocardia sputi]MBF6208732.1 hypothetical protein [Streptomyces gardneri]